MPALVDDNTMAPHDKTWMLDGPTQSPGVKVRTESNVLKSKLESIVFELQQLAESL
jgi:hypothetical protein